MFLALQMHRTVAELRDSISNAEFVQWKLHFAWQAGQSSLR